MYVINSSTTEGLTLQRLLFLAPHVNMFLTACFLLVFLTSSDSIISTIIVKLVGGANLALFISHAMDSMEANVVKTYSISLNFLAFAILALVLKNYLASFVLLGTFWLPTVASLIIPKAVPSISKINIKSEGKVYIGNSKTSDESILKDYKITHILEFCVGHFKNDVMKIPSNIILNQQLVSEKIGDKTSTDLLIVSCNAAEFARAALDKKGSLLIQCPTGVSKSAAFLIFYMLKENQKTSVQEAYEAIRRDRPIVELSADDIRTLERELEKAK